METVHFKPGEIIFPALSLKVSGPGLNGKNVVHKRKEVVYSLPD